MYDFQARRKKIIAEGNGCGVKIVVVDNGSMHGVLQFGGEYKGSESIKKALERKIKTYNTHSKKGM
jgi:hypothetical protein